MALSADGSTAAVGGPGDDGYRGAVWIFRRDGSRWVQQGSKLVGTGVTGYSNQGVSVALSGRGDEIVVGGMGDEGWKGAAWVFTRDAAGVWRQLGTKLVGSGAVGSSRQGICVAMSANGGTVAIGGSDDAGGVGAVWIFANAAAAADGGGILAGN